MRLLACLAAAVLATGCRTTSASSADPAASTLTNPSLGAPMPGALFIVGGGPRPDELMQRFVDLAGGANRAEIVVFPMASAEGRESGEETAARLTKQGARARSFDLTRADAESDSIARVLSTATGIWFGGGDQSRLTGVLLGTRAGRLIKERFAAGAVVGGTSAGAAVMTTPMLTGDERRRGGDRYPSDSDAVNLTIERGNVVTAEGFSLLPGAIVDQHFLRRRRHNRLISLVLEHRMLVGAGIDEGTALVVRRDGKWETIGQSTVVVYDARGARISPAAQRALAAADVKMHVLTPGSVFDPRLGRVEVLGPGPLP